MRFAKLAPANIRQTDWECALIFLLGFAWLYFLNPFAVPSIFQDRDIMRAADLASGKLILFGPESTGGGNLPGNFYYILLALPLMLGLGWNGCLLLMGLMSAAALALLWRYIQRHFNRETAYLSVVCLLATRYFYEGYASFWNPSYLNIFVVAVMIGLGSAFSKAENEGGRKGWLLACTVLGLGMQVHMSISVLLLAGILLQVFSAKLRLRTLRPTVFLTGLLIVGLLLSPFLLWKALKIYDMNLGVSPPDFIGEKATSTFGFLAEMPYKLQQMTKFTRIWGRMQIAGYAGFSFALPLLVVAYLYLRSTRKDVKPAPPQEQPNSIFTVWAFCLFLSFWPALIVVLYPGRKRYLTCFIVIQAMALASWVYKIVQQQRKITWTEVYTILLCAGLLELIYRFYKNHVPMNFIMLTLFFVGVGGMLVAWRVPRLRIAAAVMGLVAIAPIASFYAIRPAGQTQGKGMTVRQFSEASKRIIERTGWSYQEARSRLFFINIHFQRTPELIYEELYKEWLAKDRKPPGKTPSGYFLASGRSRKVIQKPSEFLGWLGRQRIQPWIMEGLKKKEIRLGKVVPIESGFLVPYFVENLGKQPLRFHNVGISYTSESSCLADRNAKASSTTLSDEGASFAFNNCPNRPEHCDICFKVSRETNSSGDFLRLKLTGDILSRASTWINPDWNQNIERPYLKVQCKSGGTIDRVDMINRIGFSNPSRFSKSMNGSVLAPLERLVENPCRGPIHKVTVGYQRTIVLQERALKILPGAESSVLDF